MKQQEEQKQPQPQRQKQNLSGEVGRGIKIGWRAGESFQGYALVCAPKALDILVAVIDRMTRLIRFRAGTQLLLTGQRRRGIFRQLFPSTVGALDFQFSEQ